MPVPLIVIDAFAAGPFTGNPAAVCLLERPADPAWMQRVAAEMNLAETAFPVPRSDGAYDLRWFTPVTEVDLCGHATLASAHALWATGTDADATIRFHTRSGELTAARRGDRIELDFPAQALAPRDPPPGYREAVGVPAATPYLGGSFSLLRVADEATLRALRPDMRRLAELEPHGVIVTAPADDARYDLVSRFFAPAVGIDEDPVTGSAHCALGPFWQAELGRTEMTAWQASARGGEVRLALRGDRVLLRGAAVTVLRGELLPEPPGSP
ncbi:MAG: PhzF family phenazine biosynthesis protein [Sandaracinaceae bacterium]